MFTEINEWFDKLSDDQLLERLEDSPNNYKPIINISPRIKFDFNVPEEEITTLLWSLSFHKITENFGDVRPQNRLHCSTVSHQGSCASLT